MCHFNRKLRCQTCLRKTSRSFLVILWEWPRRSKELLDFDIMILLATGLTKWGEFKLQKNCNQSCSSNFFGVVEMAFGLVPASYPCLSPTPARFLLFLLLNYFSPPSRSLEQATACPNGKLWNWLSLHLATYRWMNTILRPSPIKRSQSLTRGGTLRGFQV